MNLINDPESKCIDVLRKILNDSEVPVKQKYITILLTNMQGSINPNKIFGKCVEIPRVDSCGIKYWKLLYVLHFSTNYGNPLYFSEQFAIHYIQKCRHMNLCGNYSILVRQYANYLENKLRFCASSSEFTRTFAISQPNRISYSDSLANKTNIILDLLENIINLQDMILTNISLKENHSLFPASQLKFIVIVELIKEVININFSVKEIFQKFPQLSDKFLEKFALLFYSCCKFFENVKCWSFITDIVKIPDMVEVRQFIVSPSSADQSTQRQPEDPQRISMSRKSVDSMRREPSPMQLENRNDSDPNTLKSRLAMLESATISLQSQLRASSVNIADLQNKIMERDDKIFRLEEEKMAYGSHLNQLSTKMNSEHSHLLKEMNEKIKELSNQVNSLKKENDSLKISVLESNQDKEKLKAAEQRFFTLSELYKRQQSLIGARTSTAKAQTESQEKLMKEMDSLLKEKLTVENELLQCKQFCDSLAEEFRVREKCITDEVQEHKSEIKRLIEQNEVSRTLQLEERNNSVQHSKHHYLKKLIESCLEVMEACSVDLEHNSELRADIPSLLGYLLTATDSIEKSMKTYCGKNENEDLDSFMDSIVKTTDHLNSLVIFAFGVANSCEPEHSELVRQQVLQIVSNYSNFLQEVKNGRQDSATIARMQSDLKMDIGSLESTMFQINPKAQVQLVVESEIEKTKKQVNDAMMSIQKLQERISATKNGKNPLFNCIFSGCGDLLDKIRIMIEKCSILQDEITEKNGVTNDESKKNFYKKHHIWTNGFISASKYVGKLATLLVHSVDKVIENQVPVEELYVLARDVSAKATILIHSSRSKADVHSVNFKQMNVATSDVRKSVCNFIDSVRQAYVSQENTQDLSIDISRLNITQAKTLEMDCKIQVMKLESMLEKERSKLCRLQEKLFQSSDFAE